MLDFEVFGNTDDSAGAVIIAGIPLASGAPTNGQVISYSAFDKLWEYSSLPITNVFSADSSSVTPVDGVDIDLSFDRFSQGTEITRASPSSFNVQPGTYRLQFGVQKATFGAAGLTEDVVFTFFNITTSLFFGPSGEVSGFAPGTTVVTPGQIETVAEFLVPTEISVRCFLATGTTPLLSVPRLNIYKLN